MPRKLTRAEIERFLAGRRVAIVASIGKDGAPVLAPIWYLWRDGAFYMRTGEESLKARNVRRDSRVTVCVQDERPPYRSLTAYGRATIEPKAAGLEREMPRRYLGAVGGMFYQQAARADIEESAEVTVVMRPERIVTQDFSPETPAAGKVWLLLKRVLPGWL